MKLVCWFFCLIFLTSPVSAAEKAQDVTPLTRLNDASKKMLAGLDKNQTQQFAAIRNSQGIIRAVEDVEKNVDAANKSCGENHPEFAYTMQARVDQWKAAVNPVLNQAQDRLNTIIKLQDFAKPAEVKNYLRLVDAAVFYKSRDLKITPITDKAECKKLLGKMDDTQEDTVRLMTESLQLDKSLTP